MFSCDLRLDYLIFSLWCFSTSNHLLNGRNGHDDSVNGPWRSSLLTLHASLWASIHSQSSNRRAHTHSLALTFPSNFKLVTNCPRCISALMCVAQHFKLCKCKTKSITSLPMTSDKSLFYNLSNLSRWTVSPGTQSPWLNPQKHPWLFYLTHRIQLITSYSCLRFT